MKKRKTTKVNLHNQLDLFNEYKNKQIEENIKKPPAAGMLVPAQPSDSLRSSKES